jgi:uracil-DNA glycosylase
MENIHESWIPLFEKYNISKLLDETYISENIYPPRPNVLRVFEKNVYDIKIVLLGQDPYHAPKQAHGLSFSFPVFERKIPPSLKNIFKELKMEFPERNYTFESGSLEKWFYTQNIFLLNASLSVEKGKPGSHIKLWEKFTNSVIEYISNNNPDCVFLLLGNYAKSKEKFIQNKNKIVCAPHPSPLARGFIGSNVFIKVEELLGHPIDWSNDPF